MNNTQVKYKSTMTRLGGILLIFAGLLSVLFTIYFELPTYLLPEPAATIVDSIIYDVTYLAVFMVPVAFVPLFFKREERQPMRLDVKMPTNTFALILISIGLTYAFSYINSMMVTGIFGSDVTEDIFTYPATYMSDTDLILQFITTARVPAFCEEFLFRGTILSTLMPYGKSTAVVVSALCFGLMHGNLYQFLYTTVAGLILGAVYVATDSIWPSTIIHMLNNALSIAQMAVYERLNEDLAYVIWIAVESVIMVAGVVAFLYLIRRAKKTRNEKTSIFGKPLLDCGSESDGFTSSAKLESKDAVKAFFVPTILAFVIYQIFYSFVAMGQM